VMTWNVLAGNGNIPSIERALREHYPDVLAIQELSDWQASSLTPRLEQRYPYYALYPDSAGAAGLGVWSRYPIVSETTPDNGVTGCRCQQLVLSVRGVEVRLVNVHTFAPHYALQYLQPVRSVGWVPWPRGFSTAEQEPNFDRLVAEARDEDGPLIMVGDFNLTDRQPNYWRLRRHLQDAFREAGTGFGLTYPNQNVYLGRFRVPPLVRIDHIFHSAGITATNAYTEAIPGSDHRAVIADLAISDPREAATGAGLMNPNNREELHR